MGVMRHRLYCPAGHTVARSPEARCWNRPCPSCGAKMEPSKNCHGGRQKPADGYRVSVKVSLTGPAYRYWIERTAGKRAVSRTMGDALEELARTEK